MDIVELSRIFRFYILPILSIGFFVTIAIFGIYPSIKNTFAMLRKIDDMKNDSVELDNKLAVLKNLRGKRTTIEAYLTIIDGIVPAKTTEVVNFQIKIKELAIKNGLESSDTRTGENIIVSNEGMLGLVEIPSEFKLSGTLENVKKFLTELDKGEDFLVINEMDLARQGNDSWGLRVIFIKYQFQEITEEDKKLFTNISDSSLSNTDVLDFIKVRYGKNNPALEIK